MMDYVFIYNLILVCIMGSCLGSFANVCIYRIPREESISFPPSHCTVCGNEVKRYDLIPIISYGILRGKCRFCGEKISLRYPLVELFTAIIFGVLYIKYGMTLIFIKYAALSLLLVVIGMIDYDTTDVYFIVSMVGVILGVVFIIAEVLFGGNSIKAVLPYVYGAILGGGVITLIILLTKGMGAGDAEICIVCGLFLGWKLTVLLLFLSFVIGGFGGILLIAIKKKTRKDYIPFGPFIAIAAIITMIYGNDIISWYLHFLF
jgi:leader peptidase (prepilin peptidase)/N-methyltransferase